MMTLKQYADIFHKVRGNQERTTLQLVFGPIARQ